MTVKFDRGVEGEWYNSYPELVETMEESELNPAFLNKAINYVYGCSNNQYLGQLKVNPEGLEKILDCVSYLELEKYKRETDLENLPVLVETQKDDSLKKKVLKLGLVACACLGFALPLPCSKSEESQYIQAPQPVYSVPETYGVSYNSNYQKEPILFDSGIESNQENKGELKKIPNYLLEYFQEE